MKQMIVDPLAAALKASAVEVFQKAYEEIKFPNPPSHMHVMGVDLARGDDKTVASVTDEDGNVRILSEAEMDAFVEKAKDAFTEQIEEAINPRTFIQPMDVGQQFPIQSEDGNTIIYKISEPYSPKPPKAEDFVITKSGREKLAVEGVTAAEVKKKYFMGIDYGTEPDKTVVAVIEQGIQRLPTNS